MARCSARLGRCTSGARSSLCRPSCATQATGWSRRLRKRKLCSLPTARRRPQQTDPLPRTRHVAKEADEAVAEVAWIVATEQQGLGYARDAAETMVRWLHREGVSRVLAHVHPQHDASAAVAPAIGLTPTPTMVEGEVRW